jgi:hypothetical protein
MMTSFGFLEMDEIWEILPTFEDRYAVSSLGRIKRNPYSYQCVQGKKLVTRHLKEKILGGTKLSNKGYKRVNLDSTQFMIHQLVAVIFVDNFENKPQVNHKNGIKTDNRAINLEWVTNLENKQHAVKHNLVANRSNGFGKLSHSDIENILHLRDAGFTQLQIGQIYSVAPQTIGKLKALRFKNTNQSSIS